MVCQGRNLPRWCPENKLRNKYLKDVFIPYVCHPTLGKSLYRQSPGAKDHNRFPIKGTRRMHLHTNLYEQASHTRATARVHIKFAYCYCSLGCTFAYILKWVEWALSEHCMRIAWVLKYLKVTYRWTEIHCISESLDPPLDSSYHNIQFKFRCRSFSLCKTLTDCRKLWSRDVCCNR